MNTKRIECNKSGERVIHFNETVFQNKLQISFSSIQPILYVFNHILITVLTTCLSSVSIKYSKK